MHSLCSSAACMASNAAFMAEPVDRLAAFEVRPLAVDPRRARRDLLGDQLADHREHLAVEGQGLLRALEAVGRAAAVLGQLGEAVPVDALLDVELQVVVVREEAGHGGYRALGLGVKRDALAMRASSRS